MIFIIRHSSFSIFLKIPDGKILIFCDRSFAWFVNYFFCQISSNSNDWIVTNRQVSAKVVRLNFSSNCTCTAFNWVLSILKNPRIAGFIASLPFLTYLCYKRLKPSTHCIQLGRKIAKIEQALSTKKWSLYQWHVCFCNPCAHAESHRQERAKTVFGHLNVGPLFNTARFLWPVCDQVHRVPL